MSTPAQAILAPLNVDSTAKADAWESFNSAQNETDLQVKLMGMKNLPDSAKADLWEAKKASGVQNPAQAMGLPDAGVQAKQQLMSQSPLSKPATPLDLYNQAQAEGKIPKGAQGLEKMAPFIGAGAGASMVTKGGPFVANLLAKMAGAGVGATAGKVGEQAASGQAINAKEAAKTGGEFMLAEGGGVLAGKALEAIPNAGRAGVEINKITAANKDLHVPVFDATAEAMRAKEIADAGATPVKVVSNFLRRVINPDRPPITLEDARDFYKNASAVTAKEWSEYSGPMKRQFAIFTKALGDNIEGALNTAKAGEGTALRSAMDTYHSAMALKAAGIKGLKAAGAALGASALGGAAYSGYKLMKDLVP
jgi:hypothetical protein